MGKNGIEKFTGTTAVGSVSLLGLFTIFEGLTGMYPYIESVSKTSTWAILVTVPLLTVTYLLGLFLIIVAEWIYTFFRRRSIEVDVLDFIAITKCGPEITSRYIELKRNRQIIEGSTLGFIILSIGCLCEANNMAGYEIIVFAASVAFILVAVVSPFFANRLNKEEKWGQIYFLSYYGITFPMT